MSSNGFPWWIDFIWTRAHLTVIKLNTALPYRMVYSFVILCLSLDTNAIMHSVWASQ